MRTLAKLAWPVVFAAACFAARMSAGNEPAVGISALSSVEKTVNTQLAPEGPDPWDLVGDARGTYLPGYGAVFTFELSLVNVTPLSPFHMTATAQEIKDAHDRRIRKLAVLKSTMRELMVKAASSLAAMPADETISLEAYLFSFSFEDHTGLPRRVTMTASRKQLLDAAARHATPQELAALIGEQEQ